MLICTAFFIATPCTSPVWLKYTQYSAPCLVGMTRSKHIFNAPFLMMMDSSVAAIFHTCFIILDKLSRFRLIPCRWQTSIIVISIFLLPCLSQCMQSMSIWMEGLIAPPVIPVVVTVGSLWFLLASLLKVEWVVAPVSPTHTCGDLKSYMLGGDVSYVLENNAAE